MFHYVEQIPSRVKLLKRLVDDPELSSFKSQALPTFTLYQSQTSMTFGVTA